MGPLRHPLTFLPAHTEIRIRQATAKTQSFAKQTWRRVAPFGFTFSSLACLLAYAPHLRPALAQLATVRDLQLAVGALIGTILTLGFSLSIIPIQRASEIYTPTIIRLFREARSIQVPFLALLSLCLASFASVLCPLVGIDPTRTTPVLIIFIGISLDLLRQLYRAITSLLQPKEAVWRLEREGREILKRLHRGVERGADLAWRALPADKQKDSTREGFIKAFYARNPVHDRAVETRAAELTQIAIRAIDRSDLSLFFEATTAIAQLAIDSIEIRKSALTYAPVEFMVIKSNAGTLLDRIYENLLDMNRAAVRRSAETACGQVIRVLGRIAEHMCTIQQAAPFGRAASLAVAPVIYCNSAISECMAAGMDNMGYEGAATFARVSRSAPVGYSTELHLHAQNGIFDVIKSFLGKPGKPFHVREPLTRGLEMLHSLCQRNDPSLDHVLGTFLDGLRALVPVGLALETGGFGDLIQLPFAPAYEVTVQSSLPQLVQRSAALVKEDPERSWVNPWNDFLEICEAVFRHYWSLSEGPALASSELMFYIIPSVQMMASICLQQLANAHARQPAHAQEIERKLPQLLGFLSSSAEHALRIDFRRAEEAAKCLGWIGLTALDRGFGRIALTAARNLAHLAISTSAKIPNLPDQYVVRLLIQLRLLARLAGVLGSAAALKAVEEEEQKVIAAIGGPQTTETLNRLDNEIQDGRRLGPLMDPNDPEVLLAHILIRRARREG